MATAPERVLQLLADKGPLKMAEIVGALNGKSVPRSQHVPLAMEVVWNLERAGELDRDEGRFSPTELGRARLAELAVAPPAPAPPAPKPAAAPAAVTEEKDEDMESDDEKGWVAIGEASVLLAGAATPAAKQRVLRLKKLGRVRTRGNARAKKLRFSVADLEAAKAGAAPAAEKPKASTKRKPARDLPPRTNSLRRDTAEPPPRRRPDVSKKPKIVDTSPEPVRPVAMPTGGPDLVTQVRALLEAWRDGRLSIEVVLAGLDALRVDPATTAAERQP